MGDGLVQERDIRVVVTPPKPKQSCFHVANIDSGILHLPNYASQEMKLLIQGYFGIFCGLHFAVGNASLGCWKCPQYIFGEPIAIEFLQVSIDERVGMKSIEKLIDVDIGKGVDNFFDSRPQGGFAGTLSLGTERSMVRENVGGVVANYCLCLKDR